MSLCMYVCNVWYSYSPKSGKTLQEKYIWFYVFIQLSLVELVVEAIDSTQGVVSIMIQT